jgi:hypothetical protein
MSKTFHQKIDTLRQEMGNFGCDLSNLTDQEVADGVRSVCAVLIEKGGGIKEFFEGMTAINKNNSAQLS